MLAKVAVDEAVAEGDGDEGDGVLDHEGQQGVNVALVLGVGVGGVGLA